MIVSDKLDEGILEFYFRPPFGNIVKNEESDAIYNFTLSLLANSTLQEKVSFNLDNGAIQREKIVE